MVRAPECRYRLGVRTRGSQPRDRGSIPRTGTNLHPREHSLVFVLIQPSAPDAAAAVARLLAGGSRTFEAIDVPCSCIGRLASVPGRAIPPNITIGGSLAVEDLPRRVCPAANVTPQGDRHEGEPILTLPLDFRELGDIPPEELATRAAWQRTYEALAGRYRGCLAVAVDCHS